MTTFAKHLTLPAFKALLAFYEDHPRPEDKYSDQSVIDWYDITSAERERVIVGAMMNFFKAKLKKGELKPCPNSAGYRLNFVSQWDGLVAGSLEGHRKTWALEEMEQMFGRLAASPLAGLWDVMHRDEAEPDTAAIHEAFVKMMDAGNFPFYTLSKYESCFRTGEYLHVQFEGWTPVLGRPVREEGKISSFAPCEALVEPTAPRFIQVEFKTGNLIAMDWFRHDTFDLRAWFDSKGGDKVGSINNDSGIFNTTELYASLGFVHVFVGNSSPSFYTADGLIACGSNWREYKADGSTRYSDVGDDGDETNEEACEAAYEEYEEATNSAPAGFVDQGSVCTDLWWITMVERERLVEAFVEQAGEEHRKEIEAYANSKFDVNLQVEPGKYTLHYDAHPSQFYSLLDDKTKYGIGTPYFALTKDTE